jgi:membrane associated rhomboid family serine protease
VTTPPSNFPARVKDAFAKLRRPPAEATPQNEPKFDPTSWSGAIAVMSVFGLALLVVQIVNAHENQGLDRFGLRARHVSGLWGILTQPFLHQSYGQLLSNIAPVVFIGWVLLLSGVRVWLFVTAAVILLGGAATWLVAPSAHVIVGASGLTFGWMGYLLARAYFSRKIRWILTAIALLIFFGTLLGSLVPATHTHVPWESNVCGFAAGVFVGWLLHPRVRSNRKRKAA